MANYSATVVISPAIERTKRYLFQPFRLGRFLKLTLVALLTEGGMASCNFGSSFPSNSSNKKLPPMQMPHWPQMHWPAMPIVISVVTAVLLMVLLIGLVLGYLLIRLRFAYFDCVLMEQDEIAPGWRRYHRQALRYLGLSLLIAAGSWVFLIPVGFGLYEHFKPLLQSLGSATPPNFADFLPLVGAGILLAVVLGLIAYVIQALLGCFVLPRMAIEDATIRDALEDVWSDVQAEPGAFALFLLFRALLGFAATLIVVFGMFVVILILALIAVVVGLILKAISQTLLIVLGIPAVILVVLLGIPVMIGVGGTIATFQRNYSILFYAGRYRELALILWPPPVPAAPVPPPAVPPAMPPANYGDSGPQAAGV
jgi:hypothetical protein